MVAAAFFWGSMFTVFYVYALYPLAVTVLAALFPRRIASDPSHCPTATLLIAAYNEERCIARKLENALGLRYPRERLQIIVAADGSDDGTAEIVRGFADRGVALLHVPERSGKMAAIVRAMARARGEIVIFSDANNIYDPDALRQLVAPFADPAVGAVGGAKQIFDDTRPLSRSEGLYWKYESFIKSRETRLGSCVGAAGEILAIRRELFSAPPPHVINDDFYICMQIAGRGARVVYAPAARSVEYASSSATGEITRRARIVAGRYQAMLLLPRLVSLRHPLLLWQVVSHKFMRPLVPFAMVGALAGNIGMLAAPPPAGPLPLLRGTPPWGGIFFAAQALFYGLALLGSRIRGKGVAGKLLHLPAFLVQSNYAALLGFLGLFRGKRGVLWKRVARGDEAP